MKRMLEIEFLTFKVCSYVYSFEPAHMRETVYMTGLYTIAENTPALEKTGG